VFAYRGDGGNLNVKLNVCVATEMVAEKERLWRWTECVARSLACTRAGTPKAKVGLLRAQLYGAAQDCSHFAARYCGVLLVQCNDAEIF
jgi:hypothetical protein